MRWKKGPKKMTPRFIVVGPIDGFYHIAYKIPGTSLYSSLLQFSSQAAAEECASDMNGTSDDISEEK